MNEFEEILAKLGAELDSPLPDLEVPTVEAEGASEDERVRVSVKAGQVASVAIDPRSLRKSSVELADDVRAAVNAALEAHALALMTAMQATTADPNALRTELDGVRDEAVRSLTDYLDQMSQMMETHAARQDD